MPALAIFRLARSRRCPIVASETRNARATAEVDKPETTFSVKATCASMDSAGWQQVKISRNLSSLSGEAREAMS